MSSPAMVVCRCMDEPTPWETERPGGCGVGDTDSVAGGRKERSDGICPFGIGGTNAHVGSGAGPTDRNPASRSIHAIRSSEPGVCCRGWVIRPVARRRLPGDDGLSVAAALKRHNLRTSWALATRQGRHGTANARWW